jgi:hypothetical protein
MSRLPIRLRVDAGAVVFEIELDATPTASALALPFGRT